MNKKYILLLAILFIIAFPYILYHNTEEYNFIQSRWNVCMDYIEQGTLYEGQPYCYQGPLAFLILHTFTIFGYYFELSVAIFSFLLVIILFIYGNKIIKKELGRENLIIFSLLFCLIFLNLTLHKFACFMATFFFFFAVYVLFYTRLKYKVLYSGILIAFSIFSKFTFLAFVPFILGYYFYKVKKFNYKVLCVFLIPFLLLFAIFKIIWSNFFIYSFLAHVIRKTIKSQESVSYLQTLKSLLPISSDPSVAVNLYIALAVILFLSYLFYKNRKIIYLIPLIGAIGLYLFSAIFNHPEFECRIFLPAFLFLAIILVIEFNSIKRKYIKYAIYIILILLILLPAAKNFYLEKNINDILLSTGGVLKELPVFEGEILGNIPIKMLNFYDLNINKDKYEFLGETYNGLSHMEELWKNLRDYGIYNPREWQNYINKIQNQYLNEILSGKYSLIFFSPTGRQTDFSIILNQAIENNQLLKKYCVFKIPDFTIGLNIEPAIYLFLKKDKEKCDLYHQIITNYYTKSFSKICDKSSVAGLLTKMVLSTIYPAYINLECKYKKSDFLLKYHEYHFFKSSSKYVLQYGNGYNILQLSKNLIKELSFPKQKEIDLNNVSECFTILNNLKIGIGKVCKSVNDCKGYFEDSRAYFCEKSKFKIDYPIKVCYTKENCLTFYKKTFHNFVECNKNLCMYLSSFDNIGYLTPPHNLPFPELAGFFLETKEATKDMFLNIVEDYVS